MTIPTPPQSRVPLLERDQIPTELTPLYEKLLSDRGCVPNMFKALANVPALASASPLCSSRSWARVRSLVGTRS